MRARVRVPQVEPDALPTKQSRREPRTAPELVIQTKLGVGPAGDAYEQEADSVAAAVVRRLRSNDQGVDAPDVGTDELTAHVRPRTMPRSSAAGVVGGELEPTVEAQILRPPSGRGLDRSLCDRMEGAFGAHFSAARVHADAGADRLARVWRVEGFSGLAARR